MWLDDCPPLDGNREKRRPIIVVEPEPEPGISIVVCCSATAGPREPDSIPLPNKRDQPQSRTGLPNPCSAIPRWSFAIDHEKLRNCDYGGHLGGRPLAALLTAYLKRRDESKE